MNHMQGPSRLTVSRVKTKQLVTSIVRSGKRMSAYTLVRTRGLSIVVVVTSFSYQLIKSRIPACHGQVYD